MADFDEKLFCAWQSGDQDARDEVWAALWNVLYSVAFGFCKSRCKDDCAADEMTVNAFGNAWKEIEKSSQVKWRGQRGFVAYVRNCLIHRCEDELRRHWRRAKWTISIDTPASEGEERLNLLDMLGFVSRSPEEEILAEEAEMAMVQSVRKTVGLLAAAQEVCRNRQAQLEMLKGIEEYLRKCIAATLQDGADAEELTWDELLEMPDLEELVLDKPEMNKFLMERLGITRNILVFRMRATRDTLKALREAGND